MLNRTELMLEAVLRGLGIAFVLQRLAPYLKDGSLRPLLEAESWPCSPDNPLTP